MKMRRWGDWALLLAGLWGTWLAWVGLLAYLSMGGRA